MEYLHLFVKERIDFCKSFFCPYEPLPPTLCLEVGEESVDMLNHT
ncbi:hypothetical protein BV455_03926 [Parageobacillus caldoxylosilyticus]|nr:hypothetical protein BV455_03926 [Parageobacillus caldoxylosilyticus]